MTVSPVPDCPNLIEPNRLNSDSVNEITLCRLGLSSAPVYHIIVITRFGDNVKLASKPAICPGGMSVLSVLQTGS